jgi:hypothetical protein
MTGPDEFPTPRRTERRRDFPEHGPHRGPGVFTREQAADLARQHLTAWRAEHPEGGPDGNLV